MPAVYSHKGGTSKHIFRYNTSVRQAGGFNVQENCKVRKTAKDAKERNKRFSCPCFLFLGALGGSKNRLSNCPDT